MGISIGIACVLSIGVVDFNRIWTSPIDTCHPPTTKHVPYNVSGSINNYLEVLIIFRFEDAISPKQLNNDPQFQILIFRTEIRVNYLFSVYGGNEMVPKKMCIHPVWRPM